MSRHLFGTDCRSSQTSTFTPPAVSAARPWTKHLPLASVAAARIIDRLVAVSGMLCSLPPAGQAGHADTTLAQSPHRSQSYRHVRRLWPWRPPSLPHGLHGKAFRPRRRGPSVAPRFGRGLAPVDARLRNAGYSDVDVGRRRRTNGTERSEAGESAGPPQHVS